MAELFERASTTDLDPFTDVLFNVLLTFTFLFLVVLLLLNPPADSGIINPKAEFLVTVSWADGNTSDIDVWAEGPQGERVWYRRPQAGLLHLDRDDRGLANDTQTVNGKVITNPINQEVLTIRGRAPGDYVVNVHYYKSQDGEAVPVTVYLAEVNPVLKVLHYAELNLTHPGEEKTVFRFSIDTDGNLTGLNQLQKSLATGVSK